MKDLSASHSTLRACLAACVLHSICAFSGGKAWAAEKSEAPVSKAGLAAKQASDRKTVDLTVYNAGMSLVREERVIGLAKGANRIQVPDIPATIDPTSLHFSSLTDPAGVRVIEQNYQYDLVNQRKLLEKYLGKQVEFLRFDPDKKREYPVTGRILSVGGNPEQYGAQEGNGNPGMVAEIAGKIELNPAGRLVLPSLPEGLILKPQLEWLLTSAKDGEQRAEISYLANNISWSCDYVALLNKTDDHLDLTGWVTLVNNSGTGFRNAGLKLVAGDVNIVRQEYEQAGGMRTMMKDAAAPAPQFQQKDLFEYKIYSLQRRTDVADNESKQIELVNATNAVAKKLLIYDGMDQGWRYWVNNVNYRGQGNFGEQSNTKVGVYVAFRNDEKSGLGMALPKGKVRMYKKDDDGREQFVGEDQLDHTPKDEEVRLYMGNAFDVVGSRAQADFRSLSAGRVVEETIEIKVRNHKKDAAEVMVYEHPWRWSQWEITKTSVPFEKVDQTTIRFPLKIAADKEKNVTYTIRYTW
ncbi:MAG: hypothetical protein JWP91_4453 [Fibrobacteres bacterium]|nr:hypothetical protein [Fibrobacterota bacterium]